jgi:Protein of unknown function (DUF1822)
MNNLETIREQSIEVPLSQDDRETAKRFAAASRECRERVHRNTLAVLGVNRYLTWQGFETNFKVNDDWQIIERLLLDTAAIEIVGLGKIGCQVVETGKMTLDLPVEMDTDRLGYLTLELSGDSMSVRLLGFCVMENSIPVWRDLDEFVSYLSQLEVELESSDR